MSLAADSTRLIEIAKRAALAVDEPLLAAFRHVSDYAYKRDRHDIVTEHDRSAEEKIVAFILREVPDSTIVGEESGSRGGGNVCWYVDPIDGTTNFASGIAGWCVSIAAAIDEQLVAAVIFDPVARNLFTADLHEALLNGAPIAAKAVPDEGRAVLVSGFPNARHLRLFGREALDAQALLLDSFLAVRNLGSGAMHLAHIAAGWADATIGFSTNAWDVAAGALILNQAGGRYTGYHDGRVSEPAHLAPDYVAVGRNARFPALDDAMRRLSGRVPAHESLPA